MIPTEAKKIISRGNSLIDICTCSPFSKSVAIMRRISYVIKQAVHIANQETIPIVAFDVPFFAIATQVQWNLPARYVL